MSSPRLTIKLKIMLLGDSGVGKSYWLKKIVGGDSSHPKPREPNAAVDIALPKIDTTDNKYSFTIFNPNPNDRFKGLVEKHLSKPMDAYIIFYNVTSRQTFDNVDKHLDRVKGKNPDAKFLLLGTHFSGIADVTQEEAEAKAKKFGMQSYFGVNAKLETNFSKLIQPLNFVIRNSKASQVTVPSLNFKYCIDEIDRALRFCWDKDRAVMLKEFKDQLNRFDCFGTDVTMDQHSEMQQECHSIVTKAQTILESAFPERVKMVVFAAATAVLFTTAIVCGLALLNVFTLPILAGVLIAGCVLGGAGGAFTAGCCLFKAKENNIYSSIVETAQQAVKGFPGLKQG